MTRQQEGAYVPPRITVFRTDDLKGNFVVSFFVLVLLFIFIWHVFGLYPIVYVWLFLCFACCWYKFLVDIHGREFLFAFALFLFLCLVYSWYIYICCWYLWGGDLFSCFTCILFDFFFWFFCLVFSWYICCWYSWGGNCVCICLVFDMCLLLCLVCSWYICCWYSWGGMEMRTDYARGRQWITCSASAAHQCFSYLISFYFIHFLVCYLITNQEMVISNIW